MISENSHFDTVVGIDYQLRMVLNRYLSPITVETILDKIYQEEGFYHKELSAHDLERIYQNNLFLSVRMFCKEEQLTQVMIDLAELLENIPDQQLND